MMIFDLSTVLVVAMALLLVSVCVATWIGYRMAQHHAATEGRAKDELLTDLRNRQRAAQSALRQIGHEVRAPLTAIQTQAEIARTPHFPDEAREAALAAIQGESKRAHGLISSMIELSRLELADAEDMPFKPVNVIVVAEESMAQMLPLAETRRIELSLRADEALPLVPGDAARLKQVFLNLLDNAIKYCRPGDCVEVTLHLKGSAVLCEVHDTGPGIPKAHLPHLTQRLYRVRIDVEGSGLGLAIVEAILRRHDSALEIESESEGNNTFTQFAFALPLFQN